MFSYNPYLHSSYLSQPAYHSYPSSSLAQQRAQALAAQRARRAQWLPDEDDDEYDDDWEYNQLGPQQRAYVDALRNRSIMERERQRQESEAATRQRALEEQRWQKELDRKQKEDQVARQRIEQERERRRHLQRQQEEETKPSPEITDTPAQYTEKHIEAASTLQPHFRIHCSLQTIKTLSSQFDTLRTQFTYPSSIAFSSNNDVIEVPAISPSDLDALSPKDNENMDVDIPKLAYNSTNYNLHAYIEALDKLLVKLDGIESWGDPEIRTRRRAVVKRIEKEQGRLDNFWKESWTRHHL